MQNLNHSMWVHEILYAGRFLKDEQLLIRLSLKETKGRLKVKMHI
jgi:hypothetical protein